MSSPDANNIADFKGTSISSHLILVSEGELKVFCCTISAYTSMQLKLYLNSLVKFCSLLDPDSFLTLWTAISKRCNPSV